MAFLPASVKDKQVQAIFSFVFYIATFDCTN